MRKIASLLCPVHKIIRVPPGQQGDSMDNKATIYDYELIVAADLTLRQRPEPFGMGFLTASKKNSIWPPLPLATK